VAARVGLLVGVNALVILCAATGLNDVYGFYADWNALPGAVDTVTPASVVHGGGGAAAAVRARVGTHVPATPRHLPPLPSQAGQNGRVLRYVVTGARSRITAPVVIVLPRTYFAAGSATRSYPVLEAFSGYPGGPSQWVETMSLDANLDSESSAGRIRDALLVMPTVEVPPGRDTECVNGSAGDPEVETWLTQDVPAWVQRTFRVRTDRTAWATIGLSAGGWCAGMAAMLHPDRYSAAIVLGGYYQPKYGNWRPSDQTGRLRRRYNLVMLAHDSPPPIAIWDETSHSDRTSYLSTKEFLAAARPPLSIEAVVLDHAGHRISLWKSLLDQTLDWLGRTVPGFEPHR